jgi:Na+-driven multidrug efflux pump
MPGTGQWLVLVAQYLGDGNSEQAHDSARRTLTLGISAMSALAILCFLFAQELNRFMINDPKVIVI